MNFSRFLRWNTTVMLPVDRNVKSAHFTSQNTDLLTWNPLNTIHIFKQHISVSIKRDQNNNIKTTKKVFFGFSKGSPEQSFSRQLDLSGFPSNVKV